MANELKELTSIARRAASIAGEVVMPFFEEPLTIELKADGTPVTVADLRAEEAMRELFARETPSFAVLGEEQGESESDGQYRWVIDPIDGTKSFIHRVPLFGTLVALEKDGKPVIGVVACHAVSETAWASQGGGAFLNGEPTRVSAITSLKEATVLTTSPTSLQARSPEGFAKLGHQAALTRGWGDCYGYLAVVAGRAEAMIDPEVNHWDIAPFPILLEEAGGRLTTWSGMDGAGKDAVATNGLVHEALQAILAEKEIETS
ncbi:MAG: histidinol phosphate phosphatase [Dehalococcoidia bacterium]|nr:histidinol phosphate phosphatase [Dehalococcoidia bacterium]HCV00100.1 histidinol-phosphatase [Dehalococcoidia bacterium]|tara:strand:+ start:1170 stop:1952 length:783 start_codon:yes stop_codon:yes gene_type:complete